MSTLATLHAACCAVHTSSFCNWGAFFEEGIANRQTTTRMTAAAHRLPSSFLSMAIHAHTGCVSRCARVTSARRGVHGVMLCWSCSECGCVCVSSWEAFNHSRHLPLRLVGSYWALVHVAPSYRRWCGTSDTASHNQCQCTHERAARGQRHLSHCSFANRMGFSKQISRV